MKKTSLILAAIACTAVTANAASLSFGGGVFDGITYNVSGAGTNTGNIGTTAGDIQNDDNTVTFTFDSAVDFTITNTTITGPQNFGSTTVDANTFTADAGIWVFNAGTAAISGNNTMGYTLADDLATITGSTLGLGFQNASTTDFIQANGDWGSATINGVTSVTWVVPTASANEAFNFSAVAVPEPSSAALLGLGGLALLARRRR